MRRQRRPTSSACSQQTSRVPQVRTRRARKTQGTAAAHRAGTRAPWSGCRSLLRSRRRPRSLTRGAPSPRPAAPCMGATSPPSASARRARPPPPQCHPAMAAHPASAPALVWRPPGHPHRRRRKSSSSGWAAPSCRRSRGWLAPARARPPASSRSPSASALASGATTQGPAPAPAAWARGSGRCCCHRHRDEVHRTTAAAPSSASFVRSYPQRRRPHPALAGAGAGAAGCFLSAPLAAGRVSAPREGCGVWCRWKRTAVVAAVATAARTAQRLPRPRCLGRAPACAPAPPAPTVGAGPRQASLSAPAGPSVRGAARDDAGDAALATKAPSPAPRLPRPPTARDVEEQMIFRRLRF
jgi:hypothetical protein